MKDYTKNEADLIRFIIDWILSFKSNGQPVPSKGQPEFEEFVDRVISKAVELELDLQKVPDLLHKVVVEELGAEGK